MNATPATTETARPARTTGQPLQLAQRRAGAAVADTETVFDLDQLEVFYGAFRAVRDVTMEIHKNQITAFIGPSGCGKTTVLRCVQPDARRDPGRARRRASSITTASISTAPTSRRPRSGGGSAWCSRSRTRSRRASTTTSRSARASTASANAAKLDADRREVAARRGAVGRGQGSAAQLARSVCPVVSSSACASRARSPSSPRSC